MDPMSKAPSTWGSPRATPRILIRFTTGEKWTFSSNVVLRRDVPQREWETAPFREGERIYSSRDGWGVIASPER